MRSADVNKCQDPANCKNGRCVDTPGSYYCICDPPWTLATDRNSCVTPEEQAGECTHSAVGEVRGVPRQWQWENVIAVCICGGSKCETKQNSVPSSHIFVGVILLNSGENRHQVGIDSHNWKAFTLSSHQTVFCNQAESFHILH